MNGLRKILPTVILAAVATAAVGEFIICFIRGYSELWYSVLVPGAITLALAVAAYFAKVRWLNAVASVVWITVCVLLIGFPAYVMYLGLILGGLTLVAEITELVLAYKLRIKN